MGPCAADGAVPRAAVHDPRPGGVLTHLSERSASVLPARTRHRERRHGLSRWGDVAEAARGACMWRVCPALPRVPGPRLQGRLYALRAARASVSFVPDMFVADLIRGGVDSLSGMPVLGVWDSPFSGVSG